MPENEPVVQPGATPLHGIGLKLASVAVFMAMSAMIKLVSGEIPPGEVVFFRSAFAVPVILAWLMASRGLHQGLATRNYLGHFWRALVGTTAMGFSFAGLGLLPLPEVTAIGYAAPLLTVVFAAMFLGEEVRAFRMVSVALGMVGVLIILSPRMAAFSDGNVGATEALGAMVVLASAVFAALAQVFVRRLIKSETTSAIVFFFSLNAACLSLVTLPFGWVWPSSGTLAILVATGVFGGIGQVLLTSSYRYADTSVIAPFEYFSMLLALGVGYFGFGEVPTMVVLIGAALVVAAGILIILREHHLGLQRARQRQSMSPQG
jgi:drug/metabolite transporter (DMT)-like permease